MRVGLDFAWKLDSETADPALPALLRAIERSGSLAAAAREVGYSYRHVWNLIEEWSEFFGVPLVETRRGKGTSLTAFGEKLVWAGERMHARLGPQLENLAQELVTEIKPFLHQGPSVIRVSPPPSVAWPSAWERS